MGEILQADLDILHRLGGTLGGHADAIAALKVTASVRMPDSPIQAVSQRVDDAVVAAFGVIGGNIRTMSHRTTNAAKTYEELDKANAAQLSRYNGGR
ncbi:hypothetical protein ACWDSJ_04590 [Nocardia sp. NPDC003482]|uniref:hypothetical protein n=1 Tax=Nocardia sp. NPDC004068 TaxID=3364303 RepID=UPI0036AE5FD7